MILLGMFVGIVIFSVAIVSGIDTMQTKYPDYNGEDLFGEDEKHTEL